MSTSSNVENMAPHVIRRISRELADLQAHPFEGIKILVNDEDWTDIQANIMGPEGTPYEGGVFRVKLVLGKDFPAAPPKGFFLTTIFHPNVARNGEICVNTLKRDWQSEFGLKHILLTIKCLLIYPNPDSALNEEAGRLLQTEYAEYHQRARMMTEVHAQPRPAPKEGQENTAAAGPQAKKHAGDHRPSTNKPGAKAKTAAANKSLRRILKRL